MTAASVVIDTNVLLDLWIFDDPDVAALRAALDNGAWTALRAVPTDAELTDVLGRPQFGLSTERQRALVADWCRRARLVAPVFPAPWPCTDARDQPFLDLAVTGGARALVTKDKALLRLARRARTTGLHIISPRAVSDLMVARDPSLSPGA